MLVMPEGKTKLPVIAVQSANAMEPMEVRLVGKITVINVVFPN